MKSTQVRFKHNVLSMRLYRHDIVTSFVDYKALLPPVHVKLQCDHKSSSDPQHFP